MNSSAPGNHWYRIAALAGLAMLIASPGLAGALTKHHVVKVTELDGSESYKTMTSDDYKPFEKDLANERRLYTRALMKAQKAWKEDESTGKSMFPRRAVKPRTVSKVGTFRTAEEADKKLERYQERQAEKEKEERERDKKIRSQLRKDPDGKAARKIKREQEQEEKFEKARAIYEAALSELKAAQNKREK